MRRRKPDAMRAAARSLRKLVTAGVMPSLRARLLLWLMVPLVPFVVVTSVTSYEAARQTSNLLQDAMLLSSARTIIEDIQWEDGRLAVNVLPAALEMFESPYQDQIFYKVVDDNGKLLAGSPALDVPAEDLRMPVFYYCHVQEAPIRAVAYARQLYNDGKSEAVTVVVGKTEGSRKAMLDRLWRPQLVGECLMLALIAMLVPLGLAVELRPLIKLKNDVAGRKPMQIEPMQADGLPRELQPIVDAINQCIAQLKLHTETQRQFIADAAHQLSTPLALLDTQIQYACRIALDAPARAFALQSARRSAEKMKAMTRQLLLLAQAESAPERVDSRTDLAAVVASVLEEMIVAAERRGIDLGGSFDEDVDVAGHGALYAALVSNLVDNAIRYTHAGGHVTASVAREHAWVVLRVIDDGPGIAPDLRAHVFERFRRGATTVDGTGLGLSIVREIALRHGGSVDLGPGLGGAGLTVIVELPAWTRESRNETAPG